MNIPDEAVRAARQAAVDAYNVWANTANRDAYVGRLADRAALLAVEAATPLIVARALREAAAELLAGAHTATWYQASEADRAECGRWLMRRAERYDRPDGPGPHTAGTTAECGCPLVPFEAVHHARGCPDSLAVKSARAPDIHYPECPIGCCS